MPTEASFAKFGSSQETPIGKCNPGDPPGSLTDLSDNEKSILSFWCRRDDSGTDIYRFTWQPAFENSLFRGIPLEWYTKDNIIQRVEAGGEWIHPMTTAERRLLKLIIRHAVAE